MNKNIWNLIGGAGGFFLGFLGLGILWTGTPFWAQLITAFLFFLLAYFIQKKVQNSMSVFVAILIGAGPFAALFVQFRTPEGSHLNSILSVVFWIVGVFSGAYFRPKKVD